MHIKVGCNINLAVAAVKVCGGHGLAATVPRPFIVVKRVPGFSFGTAIRDESPERLRIHVRLLSQKREARRHLCQISFKVRDTLQSFVDEI